MARLLRRRGQRAPVRSGQQKGGVQHHTGLLSGSLLQQGLPPLFPNGQGGVGRQAAAQLRQLVLGQLRHPQAGGVGDAASLPHEGQQEGRVELFVLKDIRVPDLIAARHVHVVLRGVRFQLVEGGIPLGGEGHLLGHKGLEPVEAAPERGVVERGVGVGDHIPQRAGALEELIGACGVGQAVVDDLALRSQGLDGAHGGVGLELGPVMVGEMEGNKSCAHVSSLLNEKDRAGRADGTGTAACSWDTARKAYRGRRHRSRRKPAGRERIMPVLWYNSRIAAIIPQPCGKVYWNTPPVPAKKSEIVTRLKFCL